MTDVVVISLEAWDEVWRRNQHLIAGLLRAQYVDRVLFVEPPIDALHALRSGRRPQLKGAGLRKVDLPGSEGSLWALRQVKGLPRRFDASGDRRRARGVARTVSKLGFESPTLWANDPGGAELLALTGWPSLYDITDDWLLADRPPQELDRLCRQEAYLMHACQQVVVCSPALQRSKSSDRDVVLIPNAVDVDAYTVLHARPLDLPDGPVALYVGTLHRDRIDVDLCVATASRLSRDGAGSVVLVGPAPLLDDDIRRLRGAGVLLLGPRPSGEVPAYLQHAHVLLVPHVLTEFTASLDPIKAYEYRAAGRPVVATEVPGFADVDGPLVRVVPACAFPEVVAQTMLRSQATTVPALADVPSWTLRVQQIREVIAALS